MTSGKGNLDQTSRTGPSRVSKRRRAVRILCMLVVFFGVVGGGALYLSSNAGMQQIILPWISNRTGLMIQAAHADFRLDGRLYAKDFRIKLMTSEGKVAALFVAPELILDPLGDDMTEVRTEHLDIRVMSRMPGNRQLEPAAILAQIPRCIGTIGTLSLSLPGYRQLDGESPDVEFSGVSWRSDESGLSLRGNGLVGLSRVTNQWRLLDRTKVFFDCAADKKKGAIKGRLEFRNQFGDMLVRELESIHLMTTFAFSGEGEGNVQSILRGQGRNLVTLDATLAQAEVGAELSMNIAGVGGIWRTKFQDTKIRVDAWGSRCTVNWDDKQTRITSHGEFKIPGVSVSVPGKSGRYLPALRMDGNWDGGRVAGGYGWNMDGRLIQGEEELIRIQSAVDVEGRKDQPLALLLPETSLERLQPYLRPFGVELPNGQIAGRINITPQDSSDNYLLDVAMDVKKLDLGDKLRPFRVDSTLLMNATIRPWDLMTVSRFQAETILLDETDRGVGTLGFSLNQDAQIPLDVASLRDLETRVDLGIRAEFENIQADEEGSDIANIDGRLTWEFRREPKVWFDVRGRRRRQPFLIASASGSFTKEWELQDLEISTLKLSGIDNSFQQLDFLFGGLLIDNLDAAALVRRSEEEDDAYQFSASIRASELGHLPQLPDWMTISGNAIVNGEVSQDRDKLHISSLNVAGEFRHAEASEAPAKIWLNIDQPVTLERGRSFFSPKLGAAKLELDIPARMLSRLEDHRGREAQLDFSLRSQIKLEQKDQERPASLMVEANYGTEKIIDVNLHAVVGDDGVPKALRLEHFSLACPEPLNRVFGADVPSWSRLDIKGEMKDKKYDLALGWDGISAQRGLPDWLKAGGQLSVRGESVQEGLRIDECKLAFMGEALGREDAQLQIKGTMTAPTLVPWTSRGEMVTEIQFLGTGNEGFLKQLCSQDSSLEGELALQGSWTMELKDRVLSTSWQTLAAVNEKNILDMAVTGEYRSPTGVKLLRVPRLKLQNHPAIQALTQGVITVPEWDSLDATAVFREQDSIRNINLSAEIDGLHGKQVLTATPGSVKLQLQGQQDLKSSVLSISKIQLNATSAGKKDGMARADLSAALTDRVQVRLGPGDEFEMLRKGSLSLAGSVPNQWLAEQLNSKPAGRVSGEVVLAGAMQLSPGSGDLIADLSLLGDVDGKRCLDLSLNAMLGSGLDLKDTKLSGKLNRVGTLDELFSNLGWNPFSDVELNLVGHDRNEKGCDWEFDTKINDLELPVIDGAISVPVRLSGLAQMGGDSAQHLKLQKAELLLGGDADKLQLSLKTPVVMNLAESYWPVDKNAAMLAFTGMIGDKLLGVQGRNQQVGVQGSLALTNGTGGHVLQVTGKLVGTNEKEVLTKLKFVFEDDGTLKLGEVDELIVRDPLLISGILPAASKLNWKDCLVTGELASDASGYKLFGDIQLVGWETKENAGLSHLLCDTKLSILADGNRNLVFAVRKFDVETVMRSKASTEILADVKMNLARTAAVSPFADVPTGIGRLNVSGRVHDILQLVGSERTLDDEGGVDLAGLMDLRGTTDGMQLQVSGMAKDETAQLIGGKVLLMTDWALSPKTLNVQKLSFGYRQDIGALLGTGKIQWKELVMNGQLVQAGADEPQRFQFSGKGKSISCQDYLPKNIVMDADLTGTIDLPAAGAQLSLAKLNATIRDAETRFGAFQLSQKKGALNLSGDWKGAPPVSMMLEGSFDEKFLSGRAGRQLKALGVKADLTLNPRDGIEGRVVGSYEGKVVMTTSSNFSWKDRRLSLQSVIHPLPDGLAAVIADPDSLPRYEALEFNARIAAVEMLPITEQLELHLEGEGKGISDPLGMMRPGKLAFDLSGPAKWSDGLLLEKTPLVVKWEALKVSDTPIDAMLTSKKWNFKMGPTQVPLATLFAILNPAALPPARECAGGTVEFAVDGAGDAVSWNAQAAAKLSDMRFIDPGSGQEIITPFGWEFNMKSGREADGKLKLAFDSKGISRSNKVSVKAEWSTGQSWPTLLHVEGESPDFDPWYAVFSRPTRFAAAAEADQKGQQPPDLRAYLKNTLASATALKVFRADYQFSLDDLEYGPLSLEDLKFKLTAANGAITCSEGGVEVNGADVTWSGQATQSGKKTDFSIAVEGDRISLTPVFALLYAGESEEVRGRLTLAVRAIGSGDNPVDAVMAVDGSGKIRIDDLYFYPLPALHGADSRLAMPDLERLAFEELSGPIVARNGQLRVEPLQMVRDEGKLVLDIALRPDGHFFVDGTVKPYIKPKHYVKYFAHQARDLFGVDELTKDAAGYTLDIPVEVLRSGVNWTQNTIDKHALEPIRESAVGGFLRRVFSRKE